jgi:hypothetical protein
MLFTFNMIMKCRVRIIAFSLVIFNSVDCPAQKEADWVLEKMPVDLETDYALSALPAHLRAHATVYLLDPSKGFYISRQGSNGFICFVSRTEWEWGEFRKDLATPISYDAEGAKTIFPLYIDVSRMRASGKFTALQIKDTMMARINRGFYKAPGPGISYMVSPIMRVYPGMPGDNTISTMSWPHIMYYAPYVTDQDLGIPPGVHEQPPFLNNPSQAVLGERKGPYGYILTPLDKTEKERILSENTALLKRLVVYRSYFEVDTSMHH